MGNALTHRCRGRFADEAASALPDPPRAVPVHRRALLLRAGHLVLRKQKKTEVVTRIPIFMSPTYIVVVVIISVPLLCRRRRRWQSRTARKMIKILNNKIMSKGNWSTCLHAWSSSSCHRSPRAATDPSGRTHPVCRHSPQQAPDPGAAAR